VAAILLGYLPEDQRSLATLLVLSERLVAYFDNGYQPVVPVQTVEDLMRQAMPRSMDEAGAMAQSTMYASEAAQGQGYDNTPPPPGDDDIPF